MKTLIIALFATVLVGCGGGPPVSKADGKICINDKACFDHSVCVTLDDGSSRCKTTCLFDSDCYGKCYQLVNSAGLLFGFGACL